MKIHYTQNYLKIELHTCHMRPSNGWLEFHNVCLVLGLWGSYSNCSTLPQADIKSIIMIFCFLLSVHMCHFPKMCLQCNVGDFCTAKKGPRFGQLCDCPRGSKCNHFFLKCLWLMAFHTGFDYFCLEFWFIHFIIYHASVLYIIFLWKVLN